MSNVRQPAHVLAARAGILFASDDIEHELNLRTASVSRTVSAQAKHEGGRHDLAIIEILQNLRHYCDSKRLAFHELDAAAHKYYLEYVADSPWVSRPHLAAMIEARNDTE
ncbi:MAG TPA: hypothetical protein VGR73_22235 [Bryobacteraceae bacterium]|nr:hypothetical protein [Bryobacteraceae bacterium]